MEDFYVGEIRIFAGVYPPKGWAFCNGQLITISNYNALYSLIGTMYGGDGVRTFALPNMKGRVPIGRGQDADSGATVTLGVSLGEERVTLSENQLPKHNHSLNANGDVMGNEAHATNNHFNTQHVNAFVHDSTASTSFLFNERCVGETGNGQSHENLMPYLAINYIIALVGIYPEPD